MHSEIWQTLGSISGNNLRQAASGGNISSRQPLLLANSPPNNLFNRQLLFRATSPSGNLSLEQPLLLVNSPTHISLQSNLSYRPPSNQVALVLYIPVHMTQNPEKISEYEFDSLKM